MVTLVQQHQQTPDGNRYQKDQDRVNGIVPVEGRDTESCRGEIVHPLKDTGTVVVACDGSIAGSSAQCSDVDNEDEDEEETDIEEEGWIPNLPVPAVIQQQVATANGDLVLPNADPSNFGDVCVKNSTNVHLGNKTFYKGPVTIKQFVYTNPTSIQDPDTVKCDGARVSDANVSDLSVSKGDSAANRPILSQNPDFDKDWREARCRRCEPSTDPPNPTNNANTENNCEAGKSQQELQKELNAVNKWLWTWRCAAFLCVLALILVTAVVITSVYLARNSAAPPAPVFPEIPDSSLEGIKPRNVRFVERNEWGAQPPAEPLTRMKLPVPYVIISHTVTDFCSTQSECTFHVRFAQTFHIESRKWSDIAYNFLVGGDGLAYVGRSWNYMGAHSFGYNNISIGISFIGTFNSVIPPKKQLYAAQRIIELGVEAGKIAPDYKLLGHRQISQTLSPGDALYSIIKTWPHWSPTP